MIRQIFFVAIGGAAGSVLRFVAGVLASKWYRGDLPLATLFVNITGCFLIGILVAQLPASGSSQVMRLLLITGFCGGYTTFSAFSYENIQLLNTGQHFTALGYIFASVLAGMAAVWLGLKLG